MTIASRLLVAGLAFAAGCAHAADIQVVVGRSGEALVVEATAEFRGSLTRTWQVLTSYERYAEFIPDMQVSRIVSRDGHRVEVEQKGQARVLFVGFPIDVRLIVTEYPYERVVSRATAGNYHEMLGTYQLDEAKGRVRLHYAGRMIPDFTVPPLVGTLVFRHNIEATFRALVGEIERRQPQPPKGE